MIAIPHTRVKEKRRPQLLYLTKNEPLPMALPYLVYCFDADDTLLDYPKAERAALFTCIAEHAPSVDPEHFYIAYRRHNAALWAAFERGEVDLATLRSERILRVREELRLSSLSPEHFGERYLDELSRQAFLYEGARELVEDLARERPVAIVTNGIARVQRARLETSGIMEHLSALIISEEVGRAKPDPEIFAPLFERLECEPDQVLFVGDSISSDMEAARRAGMDFCWFNPSGAAVPNGYAPVAEVDGIPALRRWIFANAADGDGDGRASSVFLSRKNP